MVAHTRRDSSEIQWLDEIEVVGGGVIFGKVPQTLRIRQPTRQIESGGTVLALVVAVG